VPGRPFEYVDFRGGYATNIPSEQMADNEMLKAQDVTWDNGLSKRAGHSRYASMTAGDIRGAIDVQIEGVWRTVLAVEDSGTTGVTFEVGTATSFATLTYPSATAHNITAGSDVQFARMGEQVVAVNGTDVPQLIYATASSVFVDTLERYDTRDVDDAYVYAGQYSSITAAGSEYATNSAAAQSSASSTFELQSTSTGTGHWVASDQTFNLFVGLDAIATSSATFSYEYIGRASIASEITWVAYTPNDAPTWSAVGNKTSEFDFPTDPVTGDILLERGPDSIGDPLTNRFAARAVNRETSLAASLTVQGVGVQHTQYLRQLTLGEKPRTVAEHGSKIWLGLKTWLRWGEFGRLTGWQARNFEFFRDGGTVQKLVPNNNALVVMMDTSIHTIMGTSLNNLTVIRDQARVGAMGARAAEAFLGAVYFVARDGVYQWDGVQARKISKHIKADIDTYTLTDANLAVFKDKMLISFPTNSIILEFDPDTFRADSMGDGRVSFYKHTAVAVDQMLWRQASDQDGILIGLDNTNKYLLQLYSGTVDNIDATVTIPYAMQSKYYEFGSYHREKVFRRANFRVADVSVTAGDDYTIKLYTQNSFGEVSTTVTLTASVASGIHVGLVGVPPNMDGYNLGFSVEHDTQYHAKFFGMSVEVEEKAQ
jgi:hypothetical protein